MPSNPLKLIIAGSRDINVTPELAIAVLKHAEKFVEDNLALFAHLDDDVEFVTGCADGVDQVSILIEQADPSVRVHKFPAAWNTHGNAAGPIRNAQMADFADAALIICFKDSKGSLNMAEQMRRRNKPYKLIILER